MTYKTFHRGKYFVIFKRGFEESKRNITLAVDKLFENDNLRITLSEDEDPTFLCRINLTRCDYEDLKKQQGLLIDFDNFPSQIVRLLQQCATNNMFLIVQQTSPIQYNFEFMEQNEFRRLIHLSLKTSPASDSDLIQHMAETIGEFKKSLSAIKNTLSTKEMLWNDKCLKMETKIHDLTLTVSKLEEEKLQQTKVHQEALKQEKDLLAQEKLNIQRNAEINTNNQLAISQENLHKKEKEIDELVENNKRLRENVTQLEYQISDKLHRTNLLEKEVQKTHIEVATLKARNATLERDLLDKEKQISQFNSKCTYLDKAVKDNSETIKELNETIMSLKMEKGSLEKRLTLSESLVNKNTEAAHNTTEQLLKANQIISKQNSELIEMKEKLLCRTAIALEQEKVIDRNTKEIQDLKAQIDLTKQCMEKLKNELESIKEKYEVNERALKDRDETIKNNNMVIQWLHKKMEDNENTTDRLQNRCKTGLDLATSSTPYLGKNVQSELSQDTDETINFYATSKLSSIEETPPSFKKGLDPKYLKPAPVDNRLSKKQTPLRSASGNAENKGKENKVVDLPQVNYRDKKSSRPTSYRPTPVSAYFP